jgi:hypothetical protein
MAKQMAKGTPILIHFFVAALLLKTDGSIPNTAIIVAASGAA